MDLTCGVGMSGDEHGKLEGTPVLNRPKEQEYNLGPRDYYALQARLQQAYAGKGHVYSVSDLVLHKDADKEKYYGRWYLSLGSPQPDFRALASTSIATVDAYLDVINRQDKNGNPRYTNYVIRTSDPQMQAILKGMHIDPVPQPKAVTPAEQKQKPVPR